MNKTWSVLKYEFYKTVSRKSFILTLILVPLVPALVLWVLNSLSESQSQALSQVFVGSQQTLPFGVVDQSGLIKFTPDWVSEGGITLVPDEATARKQISEEKLQGYYLISPDYLETGQVTIYTEEINPLSSVQGTETFERLVQFNLLGGNMDLYLKYTQSPSYEMVEINPQTADTRDTNNPLTFFVPYGVTLLFYILIMTSSSLLLTAISKEKENRVMELLLSSLKPTELYTGKLIGLGLAGLLQMAVWLGVGLLLCAIAGAFFRFLLIYKYPPRFTFRDFVLYLGFTFYGSLMSGWGAMSPNLREGNQSTFVLMLPLLFTLISINTLISEPHGSLSTILSLLPPTAPVAMMTRLAIGGVPLWQLGLSIGLLIISDLYLIQAVARFLNLNIYLQEAHFQLILSLRCSLDAKQQANLTNLSEPLQ